MSSAATMIRPPLSPVRASLAAARANVIPGIALQLFAAALVAAYYFHDATRTALESLASFRDEVGLPFVLVSTALCGAVIPFFVLQLRRATRGRYNFPQMATLTVFWAYKGLEVSVFYALQARIFGEGADLQTIATKTCVDQFIYCSLLAAPCTWLVYAWVEHCFDRAHIRDEFRRPGWYVRCVLPYLVATWGIWIPAVAIIYMLPTPLQLPLQNVVVCFFTLLVMVMAKRPTATP